MTIDFRTLLTLMNSMVNDESMNWKVNVTGNILSLFNKVYFIDFKLLTSNVHPRLELFSYGCCGSKSLTCCSTEDQLFKTTIACVCELVESFVTIDTKEQLTILQ